MAVPSSSPSKLPRAKPTSTRCRLARVFSHRSPLVARSRRVSQTKAGGGSTCGEIQPWLAPGPGAAGQ